MTLSNSIPWIYISKVRKIKTSYQKFETFKNDFVFCKFDHKFKEDNRLDNG